MTFRQFARFARRSSIVTLVCGLASCNHPNDQPAIKSSAAAVIRTERNAICRQGEDEREY